jgi:hypothetical protein
LSDPVIVTVEALVAATVSVDEVPAAIEVGFAAIVTVGVATGGVTVTAAVAVAGEVPAAPVAVAVYVVLAAGLTACVPPVEDRT